MISNSSMRNVGGLNCLIAGLICFATVGCGGSGGSGTGANRYAGSYAGEFIDQDDVMGTCNMTVGSDGSVSGVFGYGTPQSFSGSINSSGVGSITTPSPGGAKTSGTLPITFGSAGLPTLGVGIGTNTNGAFMTMTTNPNGVFSGFSGDYAGTVHNTTLGATGVIALSISSTGVVSGVDLFNVNGTPELKSVSGTLTSGGELNYTVDGVTVTGNVSLSGATISGSLSESNGDSATISISQVEQ